MFIIWINNDTDTEREECLPSAVVSLAISCDCESSGIARPGGGLLVGEVRRSWTERPMHGTGSVTVRCLCGSISDIRKSAGRS